MDAELQQVLQSLPSDPSPQPLRSPQIASLAQLVDSDLPLQAFLEQLLPQLCTLFSGAAAVTWMKAHGTSDAIVGVRYQMDKLLQTLTEKTQHERLVQTAWRQTLPFLVQRPDNATGHWLLFAPIAHCDEPLALLEIALGSPGGPPTREPTPTQQKLFIRAAELVAQRVYYGLRQRISLPPPSIAKAVDQIDKLTDEVRLLQQQIQQRIEQRLQRFHGWAFNELRDKQAFAKHVQQMLESHGLRVECPECGHAAILRGLRIGNAKHGAFVFDHYLDSGRTFHGGSTSVPLIRVVPKPARRIAANNST